MDKIPKNSKSTKDTYYAALKVTHCDKCKKNSFNVMSISTDGKQRSTHKQQLSNTQIFCCILFFGK